MSVLHGLTPRLSLPSHRLSQLVVVPLQIGSGAVSGSSYCLFVLSACCHPIYFLRLWAPFGKVDAPTGVT